MNILRKLTIKNLKLNRKRTIVTIIGIMLSVALLVSVSSLYVIGMKSITKKEAKDRGDFHVAYYDLSKEDFNSLKQNRTIDSIYTSHSIGCAKTNSNRLNSTYAYIQGCTKSSLEKFVKISEGRLPQNDSELLVPNYVEKIGTTDVKIGAKITLNVGQKADKNGKVISKDNKNNISRQNDEYYDKLEENLKNEQIINAQEKTYTIVGIKKGNAFDLNFGDDSQYIAGYEYLTYIDDNVVNNANSNISAIVNFKSSEVKNWAKITSKIINLDEKLITKTYNFSGNSIPTQAELDKINSAKYSIDVNISMIMLESSGLELLFGDRTYIILLIVISIIVLASVFCIKNSFDISISEKIKQYAMLKSIGATNKQIRKNVFFEASVLGLIGIPLGIVTGLLPLYLLIHISNKYFMDSFGEGFKLYFEFSGIAILIAVVMGIVTIFLSALRSARKASKLTIIEGIKNSNGINIKAKKLKTPKFITKIFGIGGELSHKNLKRNKKKYRTTMLSITVSVIITIALSSFTSTMNALITNELNQKDYNISIGSSYNDDIYNKFVNVTKSSYVKNYTLLKNVYFSSNDIIMTKAEKRAKDSFCIYTINDEQYKKYVSELGLNYNDTKNKAIFMNTVTYYDYDESSGTTHKTNLKVNLKNKNKITGKISKEAMDHGADLNSIKDGKDFSLDIACITDKKPFGMTSSEDSYHTFLVVSNEFYDKNLKDFTNYIRGRFDSNDPDNFEKELKSSLKDDKIDLFNFKAQIDRDKKLVNFASIFLYSFIAIIILIGLTSIFNTITTNMELRKPEFAMLKSVGMTKKEFNRMVRLETLFMGTKSLLFGLPVGIGLSYLIYYYIAKSERLTYQFPIIAILSVIIAVFILISVIMKYSISKTNKQNIIETIRNENI